MTFSLDFLVKRDMKVAVARNVFVLIIFLLGLMFMSYGVQLNCGTDPYTAYANCFANSVVSASKTTWCSGALQGPSANNEEAAVGADCDNIADGNNKKGCDRKEDVKPYCDI